MACAVPVDAPGRKLGEARRARRAPGVGPVGALARESRGLTYIYGRQSCDLRAMEPGHQSFGFL